MADTTFTRQVGDAYYGMLQKSAEMMVTIAGKDRDIKDAVAGMQMAHLALARRNFEILQADFPVEKKRTFSQYLREAADLYEAADMAELEKAKETK